MCVVLVLGGGCVLFYLLAQSPSGRQGGEEGEGSKGGGVGQCMS